MDRILSRVAVTVLLGGFLGVAGCGASGGPQATPAPCSLDGDCLSGVQCLHLHDDAGREGPGFCNVTERQASSTSSGTAAPCTVDADCGPSVCLHRRDDRGGELGGFCRTDNQVCPRFCVSGGGDGATVCQSDRDCDGGACGAVSTCAF